MAESLRPTYRWRIWYAFAGVAFGLIFPLWAGIMVILENGWPLSVRSLLRAYSEERPTMQIILTAPLVVGAMGFLIGWRQDWLEFLRRKLNDLVRARTWELERANEALRVTQARLQQLAMRDGLTGLLNHRAFYERLQEEIYRAERYRYPLALVLADLDNFKKINDTYGHLVGDEVLRRVAEILRRQVRRSDVVARYGGEEIAILMPQTTKADARRIAERVRRYIANHPLRVGKGDRIPVTLSFGVAAYPEDARNARELVARADAALYAAKTNGRNRVEVYA